ncbi:Replication-relaxation [Roseovarius tolerans]|uniref:Replication-relaxation n=2 Tax=Roseovarius tolerans TaxID=74031 RepID=A0A1H8HCY4_9RHOB|nr:Replication-relaxation [Roseovarius tolerans]
MPTFDSTDKVAEQETMRKSRYTRSKEPSVLVMTTGRTRILEALNRYQFLRTSHIHGLIENTCFNRTQRQLRALWDAKLIDRPKEQLWAYNGLFNEEIYTLDKRGIEYLQEQDKNSETATNLYRGKGTTYRKYFSHSMMICDTLASIEMGSLGTDVRYIPMSEILAGTDDPKPLQLTCTVTHDFGGRVETSKSKHLVPDGIFGLEYSNGKKAYFVLEAENTSTIHPSTLKRSSSFLKKLIGYRDIVKTQVYKEKLGVGNMRVIVVAPTDTRSNNQRKLVEDLVGKSHLFLFASVPTHSVNAKGMLRSPKPCPELFTAEWHRAGLPTERIDGSTLKDRTDHKAS